MITVVQQPNTFTPAGQNMGYVFSSDNVANTGFRFKVTIDNLPNATSKYFYVPPNPDSVAIVDTRTLINLANAYEFSGTSVHALDTVTGETTDFGYSQYRIIVLEAWEVDGILTDQTDSATLEDLVVWNATFQAEGGWNPSVDRFVLDDPLKLLCSDRTQDTHIWSYAATFGFPQIGNKIFIPVYESDWGVVTSVNAPGFTSTKFRVTVIAENGSPTSATVGLGGVMDQNPFYPANLNVNVDGLPKPMDYPNWRCYTVQALDSANDPVSVLYVFYNVELWGNTDCRYDRVRMAWKGFGGSWEYFNFTKKNEKSNKIERKRYQQVLGTYGATFTQNGMQRGRTEVGNITERLLTINSDWISEGEYEFLRGMMVSKQVHWVQDDGTFIPMLVEDDLYTEQRTRDGKLKNLTVKLSYANNLWT